MKKQLSSDAVSLLSWIDSNTLIDPDDWHFNISAGGKRIHCTPQLQRDLVRRPLVEINEYKPNLLSAQLKKDFNLVRIANQDELILTDTEIERLKDKLDKLAEDGQIKFWIKCIKEDSNHKLENSIISAWMIDIQDVIDYMNGKDIEALYYRIIERRRKFDSPFI